MRIIPLLAALGLPFFAFADNEAAAGCIAAISEQYDTLVSTPIERRSSAGKIVEFKFNGETESGEKVKVECRANQRHAVLRLQKRPGHWESS